MIYRIFGGISFLLIGATGLGIAVPTGVTALFCVVAGIALLAAV